MIVARPLDSAVIKVWKPVPDPAARLYAFPHAGGGAAALRAFCAASPDWLEVRAIRLGGRERRIEDPLPGSLDDVVAEVSDVVANDGGDCQVFWLGVCSGAVLALEMASRLAGTGACAGLVVVSSPVPGQHQTGEKPPGEDLESAVQSLRELGGLSAEIATSPEALELFLPAFLADRRLAGQFRRPPSPPLPVPILAIRGTDDSMVTAASVQGWAGHTSSDARVVTIAGGHFLLSQTPGAVAAQVASFIRALLAKPPIAKPQGPARH